MAKFNEQHVFTGMQRDIDVSKHPASFLYDARNIRLTQRDGEGDTLYAITNEKGTELTSISIVGNYLGHALLNQYLVVFSKDDSGVAPPGYDTPFPDWITRIDLSTLTTRPLYHGDLGFDFNYPISAIGYYENENIQKVYWTDGKNQPRVIDIIRYVEPEVDTQFDFLPTLSLNEKIYVTKQTSATGSFPPGVIQYMFTYYRRFGQESNIFYTTPLLYISPLDRGGAPDEKISNSFKITIEDIDTDHNFDYIRIYSLQRTSKDGTPIAKMVRDIAILPNITAYTFIDTGAEGESIDPTELLYKQREAVIVNTLEQKDNTIFLGDIQYEHEAPPAIPLDSSDNPIITINPSNRTIVFSENNERDPYVYYNQLNALSATGEENVPCGGFKRGEYYRLGVQFQDKFGKWSDPLFVKDEQETNWPSEAENTVTLPTFTGTIDSSYVDTLISMGYKKARAVVVFPDIQDREILCQGVTCPTVYREKDREDAVVGGTTIIETQQCQSSWFFRPVHSNVDNLVSSTGAVAPTYTGEIPTSAEIEGAGTLATLPRRWEIQGYYNPLNRFRVSSNDNIKIDTFHSPDVEFASNVVSQNFGSTMYKIVGYTEITKTLSDIDIQTKSPTISNMGSGFDHHSLVSDGAKGIISGLFYDDFVVDEIKGNIPPYFRDYDKEQSSVKWLVYPWHRSGSLNNDLNRPANAGVRSAELSKKKISNLRYGKTTWITKPGPIPPTDDGSLAPTPFFQGNGEYPELFMDDSPSILKIGNTIYKGNVDTVLMPDLPDGFYFCFNDSITDVNIKNYMREHGIDDSYADIIWMFISTTDTSSFTSPVVALNETDFTSESWWKTFAISEGQSSSPSTQQGTVQVITDFGTVYIQRKVGDSYVNEGSKYVGTVGTLLILNVVPQNGYSVTYWRNGGPEGKIIVSSRKKNSIKITVDYGVTTYYVGCEYVGESSGSTNMAHIHLLSSPNNAGIVTGEGDYAVGTTVVINATPNLGYSFVNWKNSEEVIISTESSASIIVPSTGGLYTAYFESVASTGIVRYYIIPSNSGEIDVYEGDSESSTSYSEGDTETYPTGTELRFRATSYGGRVFYGFVIDGQYTGSIVEPSLTVFEEHNVAAYYQDGSTQTLIYEDTQGSISVNGEIYSGNGSGDTLSYPIGAVLNLDTIPKTGYRFDHWEIDGNRISSSATSLTVSANHVIRAVFEQNESEQSVQEIYFNGNQGSVTANESAMASGDDCRVDIGNTLTLVATPKSGYVFDHWEDGETIVLSTSNTYSFIVSEANYSIYAIFAAAPSNIKVYLTSNTPNTTVYAGLRSYVLEVGNETAIDYTEGMELEASNSGKTWIHWWRTSDDTRYSTSNPLTLTGLTADLHLSAIFN